MILLLDVGNTHTHAALAVPEKVRRHRDFPTAVWSNTQQGALRLRRWTGRASIDGVALCSVVPPATRQIRSVLQMLGGARPDVLTAANVRGVGIDYPRPKTIGPDRLANAIAARSRFGAPVIVVDFGTAVTLDIVDSRGCYVGGIIAPGLAAMTDYLHERTALLPRIRVREPRGVVGRSTEEAMRIGAVVGYRGLIRELIARLRDELGHPRIPVVATGGYASLLARGLPEIGAVDPGLTLEGLRIWWEWRKAPLGNPRSANGLQFGGISG